MKKINREEYEVLKGLEDIWKWIARDNKGYGTKLRAHTSRPGKMIDSRWSSGDIMLQLSEREGLFQFIQWEDSEPWSVQELIEEYERESEGAEVKNLKEIRSEFENKLIQIMKGRHPMWKIEILNAVSDLFNQLEEPEVLSPEWLEENEQSIDYRSTVTGQFVESNKLKNIIVPKQELPTIPQFVSDWIEETKKQRKSYIYAIAHIYDKYETDESLSEEENRIFQWMEAYDNDEVFARAWLDGYTVEEEKYYLKIGNLYLAEPLGNMTSDIVRMTRDKEVAYQFTDEKSIATHLDKFEGMEAVKAEEL